MTTRDPPAAAPFPHRAFIAIGVVWLLLDIPIVLAQTAMGGVQRVLPLIVVPVWLGILAARAMLMLGWWFLGEGKLRHRVAGLLLFSLAALPLAEREIEGFLFGVGIFLLLLAPVSVWTGMGFVVLRGLDYRLVRNVPVEDKTHQFTLRQLLLLTLIFAVVSALLRLAQQSDRNPSVFAGLSGPLLVWVFPFIACRGLLKPRWYPDGLFAAGLAGYLAALPLFALRPLDATVPTIVIASYIVTFSIHLLILRYLGFRLVQLPSSATSQRHLPADWGAR